MKKITGPGTVHEVGRHLWGWCAACKRYIKLTGPLRGIHYCVDDDDAQ